MKKFRTIKEVYTTGVPYIEDKPVKQFNTLKHVYVEQNTGMEEVVQDLVQLGYNDLIEKSSKRLVVMVPTMGDRIQAFKHIMEALPCEPVCPSKANVGSASSIGGILHKGVTILVKPRNRQGAGAAGVGNELTFINAINETLTVNPEYDSIDVILKGSKGTVRYNGVTKCEETGRDVIGGKKADCILVRQHESDIPISLKMKIAENWESADKRYIKDLGRILSDELESGRVKLTPIPDEFTKSGRPILKIKPEVGFKASEEEAVRAMFGTDILKGNGAIVFGTFVDTDFKLHGKVLTINVDKIIDSVKDVMSPELRPYVHIRNQFARNHSSEFPGIRISIVSSKRINKNTHIIDHP